MRLKHNPWISLLAALVMTVIVLLYFTGCGASAEAEAEAEAEAKEPPRFTGEYAGIETGIARYYTITDTKTGAQYLLVCNSYGMAMAELEG